MSQEIVALAKKFVSIKSTQNNSQALEEILVVALSHLKGHTIERFEQNGVKSALIYNSRQRPKRFRLLLNGHLDIIPGKEYQYIPTVKNDRLYGVGSMDMKSSVATLITVFRAVANKVNYPLGLQLVTDEEIGGFNGTQYQIDQGVRSDFVIAGESTNLQIVNKAKGILWVKISAKGKTAHGAYPWRGHNAIGQMRVFLNILGKKYTVPTKEAWKTTINISKIETKNQSFNKIPDDCVVWLDIRYIPEESNTIVNDIKKLLPKGFTIDIVLKEPALLVDESNFYLKALQRVNEQVTKKRAPLTSAHGSSDARHFSRVHCAGIEFGPIGGGIGTDNEWINIKSLETCYRILFDFCLSLNK